MFNANFVFISLAASLFCWISPVACLAQQLAKETEFQVAVPLYADQITAPLSPVIVEGGSYAECTWQKIVYTGKNSRVPALFFLPTGTDSHKPIACLLLLHGLGGSKEQMVPLARFLASIGYSSFAIDDAGSGERALPDHMVPTYNTVEDLTSGVTDETVTTIVDLRRGIDYLDTRPEIDHNKIGAMGFSLGALLGAVLGGVEPRLGAVILVSGGGDLGKILVYEAQAKVAFGKIYAPLLSAADPAELDQQLAQIDPINFIGHIAPRPLLMEHGQLDKIIPASAAKALYDAALQPKEIDWYPNAGHIPPPLDLYPSISVFLDKYLPLPGR